MSSGKRNRIAKRSTRQPSQKFLLVHAVLEGFAAIDEDDRDFIVELAAEVRVAVDIDFLPGESTAAGEFREAFLYDFTQVTALARVHNDAAKLWHAG